MTADQSSTARRGADAATNDASRPILRQALAALIAARLPSTVADLVIQGDGAASAEADCAASAFLAELVHAGLAEVTPSQSELRMLGVTVAAQSPLALLHRWAGLPRDDDPVSHPLTHETAS